MKRFIIISLLAVLTVPSFGCLWIDTDNYYLFNICNGEDFAERADKITRDNWKVYLGADSGGLMPTRSSSLHKRRTTR